MLSVCLTCVCCGLMCLLLCGACRGGDSRSSASQLPPLTLSRSLQTGSMFAKVPAVGRSGFHPWPSCWSPSRPSRWTTRAPPRPSSAGSWTPWFAGRRLRCMCRAYMAAGTGFLRLSLPQSATTFLPRQGPMCTDLHRCRFVLLTVTVAPVCCRFDP